MERFLAFSKFALTKLVSKPASGCSGVMASSGRSSHDDRSWHEDYLIGKSDIDSVWYYERRRWRS